MSEAIAFAVPVVALAAVVGVLRVARPRPGDLVGVDAEPTGERTAGRRPREVAVQLLFLDQSTDVIVVDCVLLDEFSGTITIPGGTPLALHVERPADGALREWVAGMLRTWCDEGRVVELSFVPGPSRPRARLESGSSRVQLPVVNTFDAA